MKNKKENTAISEDFFSLPAKMNQMDSDMPFKIWNVGENVSGKIPDSNASKKELDEMFPIWSGEGKDTRMVSWSGREDQPTWHVCTMYEDVVTPDGYVGQYVSGYGETLEDAYAEWISESKNPLFVTFEEFKHSILAKKSEVLESEAILKEKESSRYVGMMAVSQVLEGLGTHRSIVRFPNGKEFYAVDVGVAVVFGNDKEEYVDPDVSAILEELKNS